MRNRLPLSRKHQRGAILIMTAAFIVAAVALLALAVDTGRLYAAQAKLQSTANLAALAAARQASGCRTDSDSTGEDAANALIQQNYPGAKIGFDPENAPATGKPYEQGTASTYSSTNLRTFSADNDPDVIKPNAVRLTLTDTNYAPLFSIFQRETSTRLHASAGAISRPEASLQFGTTLVEANLKLLSRLLGVDVAVADLGDLANLSVSLAELLAINSGIATKEDLADVTIGGALANVSATAEGLSPDLRMAITSAVGNQPLAEILDIAGPVGTSASIALGSIVNAATQLAAARRQAAVKLPLDNLPPLPLGLGGVSANVRILSPPKTVLGPAGKYGTGAGDYYTKVYSSQASIELALDLSVLAAVKVHLPLAIQLARGEADLAHIKCPTMSDRFYTVTVEGNTSPVSAAVGSINPDGSINTSDAASVTARVLFVRIPVATITNRNDKISDAPPARDFTHTFEVSALDALPKAYEGDENLRTADITSLLNSLNLQVNPLGLHVGLLNGLLGAVTQLLQGLVNPILSPLLDPVLKLLGISLATPTLALEGLTPSQPSLFCTSQSDCYERAASDG